ncbi:MAG TPA: hypothetical protein PLN69_08645 [bacterium]|nr:hypothetical protein [bacterium]
MMLKKAVFFAVFTGLILVLGLGLLEFAMRAVHPPERDGGGGGYVDHGGYHVLPANASRFFENEDGLRVEIKTDAQGLRNPAGLLGGADVVLAGDSFIIAQNTPEDNTVAGRLRAAGVNVYNAGMDGFSTFNELNLLAKLLEESNPSVVIIVFYLGNDLRDNYLGLGLRGGGDSGLRKSGGARGGLMRACRASVLCGMLYDRVYVMKIKKNVSDPYESYCLGEIYMYRSVPDETLRLVRQRTDAAFAAFAKLARERGFRPVVAGVPSKAQVYRSFREVSQCDIDSRAGAAAAEMISAGFSFDNPDAVVAGIAEKNGIEYHSLLPMFRDNADRKIYYYLDRHWTADGQELAADFVLRQILK